MSKVTETRVKITLTDAMSGPLRGIQGQLNSTNTAANNLSKSLKDYAAIGAGIAAGATGIYSLTDKIGEIFSQGAGFYKSMETNAIGMAGILTSMTTLNGETLKWNDALNISQGIINKLNDDALKTAATSEELITTFRALLGPGLGAGMNIEQIQKLTTVGVNAVKSLGLNKTQLVQELRDLVQGGIQPASSTLATALGLKDSDIKAAKASAEGLYSFLMKRLQGFEQAALATPQTLTGMQEQLQEGLTRSLAVGLEPVMNEYKDFLQAINSQVISPDTGINQEFVANIKMASEHVANMWQGFENIAGVAGNVLNPAIQIFGSGLAFAMDNVDKIAFGFAAWKSIDVFSKIGSYLDNIKAKTMAAAEQEILSANNAAQAIVIAENKKQAALKQTESINKAIAKLNESGNATLATALENAAAKYQKLGLSAEQAGKLQYQAAKLAAKGQNELATAVLNAQEKHLLAAQAAQKQAQATNALYTKTLALGSGLTTIGMLTSMVSDDTNSWTNEMGQAAIEAGILLSSVVSLTEAIKTLKLTSMGGLGLVAAGVAAIGYGAYEKYKHAEAGGEFEYDELGNVTIKKGPGWEADHTAQEMQRRRQADKQAAAVRAASEQADNLEQKFPKVPEASTKKSAAERAAEKAKKEFEKNERAMNDLMAELDRKILEVTGSQFDINMAKLDEELQKMQSKIDKAALAGVDTSGAAARLQEFQSQEIIRIKRQEVLDKHQLEMDYIDARQEANLLSAQQADEQRLAELNSYKAQLQEMLSTQRLTLEQRLQLEQEYAATIQAIQQAQATDWQASWDSVLAHVRDTQFDQLATLEDGWDDITSTIANFGQNMLTEQKSFSERCKDLYNDLANSIMNTMMKVIMQGLVMKAVMGAFGFSGGGGIAFSSDPSWNVGYMAHANGGIASGWSLVGEEGPELVNFTNPGRVYTAEQTAAALGGKDNPTNVKVVIENRSGEKVEATSANASFDGEGLIVGIVLDALRTNKNGMQDAVKALAGNY